MSRSLALLTLVAKVRSVVGSLILLGLPFYRRRRVLQVECATVTASEGAPVALNPCVAEHLAVSHSLAMLNC